MKWTVENDLLSADFRDLIVDVRAEWMKNFYRSLELTLEKASGEGKDVAVSEMYFDPETQSSKIDMVTILPGAPLPLGKSWTIYHSSRPIG